MTDREVMQMALDTVQDARDCLDMVNTQAAEAKSRRLTKTLEALRAALAHGEQEPVAWGLQQQFEGKIGTTPVAFKRHDEFGFVVPLYTSPPQRPWQGLTDEEIEEGQKQSWVDQQAWQAAVWWAEDKLREKNS